MPNSKSPGVELVETTTPTHFAQARDLMGELMTWDSAQVGKLGLDAALVESFYYNLYDLELPGDFTPPEGSLLLAIDAGEAAGCGGFTRSNEESCELKRLYVRDAYRGRQIAAQIVISLIDHARRANYRSMRLETVTFMKSAIALYRSIGFKDCDAYYEIPEVFREITVFMELDL